MDRKVSLRGVLVLWIVFLGLSAGGVWSIRAFGPAILLRDQTRSAWHYLDQGWQEIEASGAEYGSPQYVEALVRAEPHFYKAVELAPEVGKYRIDLARNLYGQGRLEEALEQATKALSDPDSDDAYLQGFIGELSMKLERWEEAEAPLRRAVELDPETAVHRERLAKVLLKVGKVDEGIEVWKERFEDLPALPIIRVHAAHSAAQVGRWKEAEEWFEIPADEGLIEGTGWIVVGAARAANDHLEEAAEALAHYKRLRRHHANLEKDLAHNDIPPLEPELMDKVRAAYRRALAANWRD
jgi:tetratricopeptide (TPR) repeat protein